LKLTDAQLVALVTKLKGRTDEICHQSCGVDSYSVTDALIDHLSSLADLEPDGAWMDRIVWGKEHVSDDVARAVILVIETINWAAEIERGRPLNEVLSEIDEVYLL